MKTKQLIATVALCSPLLIMNVKAQSLYFGIDAGYGFSAAKQEGYGNYKSSSNGTSSTEEYTSTSLSLGKGLNAGVLVGYMFNKNIGAELGASYLMGGENKIVYEYTGTSSSSKNEYSIKGSMIRLTPSIKISVGENKLRPYMKTGLIVGLGAKATEESNLISTGFAGESKSQQIVETTGNISLGFHGCLGINYALSDKLSLFGEVAGNYQSWSPKKAVTTTYTVDGIDQVPLMKTSQLETEYVDSYTRTSGVPPDESTPSKSTKIYLPFSSVGIHIGLVFTLGGSGS